MGDEVEQEEKKMCNSCTTLVKKSDFNQTNWELENDNLRSCNPCIRNLGDRGNESSEDDIEDKRIDTRITPTHLFAWEHDHKWHPCRQYARNTKGAYLQLWLDPDDHSAYTGAQFFTTAQMTNRLKIINHGNINNAYTDWDEADILRSDFADPPVTEKSAEEIIADDLIKIKDKLQEKYDNDDVNSRERTAIALAVLEDMRKSTNNGDSYAGLLFTKQSIHNKFKPRFPKNANQYYSYSFDLHHFIVTHPNVPESAIIKEIIQNNGNIIQTAWTQYLTQQLQSKSTDPNEITKFTTSKNYESFILNRLNIRPNILYFTEILRNITSYKNENPRSFFERIERYHTEISDMITKLNANDINNQIRSITYQEKYELCRRVFTIDNDSTKYGNNGRLNTKVKTKVSQWFLQNQFTTPELGYREFKRWIQTLDTTILPSEVVDTSEDGKYWTTFKSPCPIFKLRPYKAPNTGTKRKNDDKKPSGPPSKRVKFNLKQYCKYNAKCRSWMKTGKCNFRHTVNHIQQMNRQRNIRSSQGMKPQQQSPTKPNNKPVGSRSWRGQRQPSAQARSDSSSSQGSPKRPRCRYARECRKIQTNQCEYYHSKSDRKCAQCHTIGHVQFQCRKRPQQQPQFTNPNNPNNGYPRYNPMQNPNAMKPQAHTLNMETIQYVQGQPYHRIWAPLDINTPQQIQPQQQMLQMPIIDKAAKLQQMTSQMNEYKSLQKQMKNQINSFKHSPETNFDAFMAKSNNPPNH